MSEYVIHESKSHQLFKGHSSYSYLNTNRDKLHVYNQYYHGSIEQVLDLKTNLIDYMYRVIVPYKVQWVYRFIDRANKFHKLTTTLPITGFHKDNEYECFVYLHEYGSYILFTMSSVKPPTYHFKFTDHYNNIKMLKEFKTRARGLYKFLQDHMTDLIENSYIQPPWHGPTPPPYYLVHNGIQLPIIDKYYLNLFL